MLFGRNKSEIMDFMAKVATDYFENGGVAFSSKKLRKAFKDRFCRNALDTSHIYMADVYAYLFEVTFYHAFHDKLACDGFFEIRSKVIEDALSIPQRRIREICNSLVLMGLIEVKKQQGYANRFRIVPTVYESLVNSVEFDYKENEFMTEIKINIPNKKESTRIF